jgi:hypothetical protein
VLRVGVVSFGFMFPSLLAISTVVFSIGLFAVLPLQSVELRNFCVTPLGVWALRRCVGAYRWLLFGFFVPWFNAGVGMPCITDADADVSCVSAVQYFCPWSGRFGNATWTIF